MKECLGISIPEELLQAVTFFIWFVLAWCIKKSSTNTIFALRVAFDKSNDYKKEEILSSFKLGENLF